MTNPVQTEAIRVSTESGRRIRVLLVDDQPIIGEAIRRMLAPEADVDFRYCSDPTQAMEMAAEFKPTVILQDLVLPEVDGLTMLRFYRANPATKDIPTIVLSTKEEATVKAEAFTLGATDYLVKLPDPIELTARIRHHSRGYIAQMELIEAQEKLVMQEKMASLGGLTAGIAHEIKNPLNFVNNFAALCVDLTGELRDELKRDPASALVEELLTDLEQNARRIAEHGKRADRIVQGMLLHSRGTAGDRRPTDINTVLDESVNLAYHGLRAKDSSFNVTIERDYDASIGLVEVVPQDISRVFLNIVNNACYSAHQKAKEQGESYSPTLRLASRNLGNWCEIRIEDNGLGIPKTVIDKIFNPFFTTKPPGEGTGLGLSLSYETVVRDHHGDLRVETKEGECATFIIRLPKTAAAAKEAPEWPTKS